MFVQLLANGLVTGSVIALAAAGVSIVYGILRLVNFAYGDYMTFGAFIGILFNVKLDLPIVPAAMLAMAATAVLSVALELVLWRPLRAKSAGFMSLFLVSVGLAGSGTEIIFKPLPEDDPRQRRPDLTRARKLLRWEPRTSLDAGVTKTIVYFRDRLNTTSR